MRGLALGLDPERIRSQLGDSGLPYRVELLQVVGSTQDRVCQAARLGAEEGLVIFAEEQTRGRGRAGRNWVSPAGTALMFSVLLRPTGPPAGWSTLGLAAGLALAEGLSAVGGPQVQLKWPNDCLCRDLKLAGILAEIPNLGRSGAALILGVGCNLFWREAAIPEGLRHSATACDLEGARVDPTRLAVATLRRLASHYRTWLAEGFAPIRPLWWQRAAWIGRTVVAEQRDRPVRGRVVGITELGELLLRTPRGQVAIAAGELRPAPPGAAGAVRLARSRLSAPAGSAPPDLGGGS
ncbi:MAG: biotin--[acetyl-CoA-carboxylase] ligase [Candidatus Dormibacteria bacterium]